MLHQKFIDICNTLGWSVTEYDDGTVGIEAWSPLGEDLVYEAINPDNFIAEIAQITDSFDVDDHVEMWVPSRGTNGVPSSISDLVEDAKDIKEMLEDLSKTLNIAAKHLAVREEDVVVLKLSEVEYRASFAENDWLTHRFNNTQMDFIRKNGYGIYAQGTLAGVCALETCVNDIANISLLLVHNDWRRQGFATKLLDTVLPFVPCKKVSVSLNDPHARDSLRCFYETYGLGNIAVRMNLADWRVLLRDS